MRNLWEKLKSFFVQNGENEMIKEEEISYREYKDRIKNKKISNIKEVKVIPPSFFGSNETRVKIRYKEAKNKKKEKTKRVVHDERRIKMKNPDLNKNGRSSKRWRNPH